LRTIVLPSGPYQICERLTWVVIELTIFDILTRPGPNLTSGEHDRVKKVARQLLEQLNALLVSGCRLSKPRHH